MVESLTVFDDVFVSVGPSRPATNQSLQTDRARVSVPPLHGGRAEKRRSSMRSAFGTAALISDMNGVAHARIHDKPRLIAYADPCTRSRRWRRSGSAQRGMATTTRSRPTRRSSPSPPATTGHSRRPGLRRRPARDRRRRRLAEPRDPSGTGEVLPAPPGPAEDRLRLLHTISNITDYRKLGGYQSVLAVHAEGSIEAEKLQMARSYDAARDQLHAAARGHRHDRSLNPPARSGAAEVSARSRAGPSSRPTRKVRIAHRGRPR